MLWKIQTNFLANPAYWNGNPTPVFLPGKSHGQRSLAGYSLWGREGVRHGLATKQQQIHWIGELPGLSEGIPATLHPKWCRWRDCHEGSASWVLDGGRKEQGWEWRGVGEGDSQMLMREDTVPLSGPGERAGSVLPGQGEEKNWPPPSALPGFHLLLQWPQPPAKKSWVVLVGSPLLGTEQARKGPWLTWRVTCRSQAIWKCVCTVLRLFTLISWVHIYWAATMPSALF